jgi:hypothetical protein
MAKAVVEGRRGISMLRSPQTWIHTHEHFVLEKKRAHVAGLLRVPQFANDNYKQGGTKGFFGEFYQAFRKVRNVALHFVLFERASGRLKRLRKKRLQIH